LKPFDVFICYKKSSGKDYADHLRAGLEELGLHSFIDSKNIPQIVDGKEEWKSIRDKALDESKIFILLITPGFALSGEVRNELSLARKTGNKTFIYFRHRDLGRKIVIDLDTEKVDLGRQQQVSFETKEELLRLAYNILLKDQVPTSVSGQQSQVVDGSKSVDKVSVQGQPLSGSEVRCLMCTKPIEGKPFVETINGEICSFDSHDCACTYKKLKSVFGKNFE
jgi:hypothetical protein